MQSKPCPLCGSERVRGLNINPEGFGIHCADCGVGLKASSSEDAVRRWGKRSLPRVQKTDLVKGNFYVIAGYILDETPPSSHPITTIAQVGLTLRHREPCFCVFEIGRVPIHLFEGVILGPVEFEIGKETKPCQS